MVPCTLFVFSGPHRVQVYLMPNSAFPRSNDLRDTPQKNISDKFRGDCVSVHYAHLTANPINLFEIFAKRFHMAVNESREKAGLVPMHFDLGPSPRPAFSSFLMQPLDCGPQLEVKVPIIE